MKANFPKELLKCAADKCFGIFILINLCSLHPFFSRSIQSLSSAAAVDYDYKFCQIINDDICTPFHFFFILAVRIIFKYYIRMIFLPCSSLPASQC
jgi:hypothetical protein